MGFNFIVEHLRTSKLLMLFFYTLAVITNVECLEEYQSISLREHNDHRKVHSVDPLKISDDLNEKAVRCAEYYASNASIDHLWMQTGGSPTNPEADAARSSASMWYDEESQHDYNKDFQPASGHFSQMVWKSSKKFGFGVAQSGNVVVGCGLYSPHGNVEGEFAENVFPPNSKSNSNNDIEGFEDNGDNVLSLVSNPLFLLFENSS